MTIGEVLKQLRRAVLSGAVPPDTVVPLGIGTFSRFREVDDAVVFAAQKNATVVEMIDHLVGVIGFDPYGDDGWTPIMEFSLVMIEVSDDDQEPVTRLLLAYMLGTVGTLELEERQP